MENFNKVIRLDEYINKNIISLDRGRVISSIDINKKPGNHPVYSSSSQKSGLFGTFDEFDFDEELITWSVDGGGYFFYRPKHKFSVTNVSGILRILDNSKLDYKFLFYLLDYQHSNQLYDYVDKAHPSVIKKRYYIPEIDIIEQSKIAEILSKVDNAISQTEIMITKYNRIKTGLIQDLLTKGIDEKGNIRSEEIHEFKNSPLCRIPKQWEVEKLGDLTLKIGDGTHSSVVFSDDDIVPFLFVSCIKPNKIDWSKKTSISLNEYNKISKGKEPKNGTVLYSLVGSYGNAVKLNSNERLSFQRHIGFIETKRDILIPEFLTLFLNSCFGKMQADDLAVGNAQKTITLGALSEFKIIKPSVDEQKEIIEKNDFLEKQISNFKKSLIKHQSIKTGLMQDLLSGKKRVTHLIN